MSEISRQGKRGRTCGATIPSTIHLIYEREQTRRRLESLEHLLKTHGIRIPGPAPPQGLLSHRLLYECGVWPTEYESVRNNAQQHLVINKTFSVIGGTIEIDHEPCDSLRHVGVLANELTFAIKLLRLNTITGEYEELRNENNGTLENQKDLLAFNMSLHASENVSFIDTDTVTFTITSTIWAISLRVKKTSGTIRNTPTLFKLIFTPQTDDIDLKKRLTIETLPFRSISRPWKSVAIRRNVDDDAISTVGSATTVAITDADNLQ